MDLIKDYLPPADKGYLPYYMLTLSLIAVGNSFQNYKTLHYTRRLYNGLFVPNKSLPAASATFAPADQTNKLSPAPGSPTPSAKDGQQSEDQVTPLAARLFGTYTLISAIVRIYASYNLHLAPIYNIALWTYIVAALHFGSEWAVFKTTHFGKPLFFPAFFASIGITWMVTQRGFYVEV
ncbi:uncharacterized protein B0I36DRAFT_324401 [Microdochium trichocladiopsis]|uniref:Ergosterol biosynthetic protein 28 n=1 Tax=Microdochium trichocladiopsis TaxID=1682393 RepID=A0A9P8Y9Z5_9PEZI|nr:uncharacterized protein B0I36DRAFT_324401 [Microdochium trichocladiopsis]KAH7031671.1 hypothetical protein B0I36DRAFT_324401 [Microdochium trichocladiopsis]